MASGPQMFWASLRFLGFGTVLEGEGLDFQTLPAGDVWLKKELFC